MSWKGSGDFRGGSTRPKPAPSSSPSSTGPGPSSVWDAGSAGGPSLLALIVAACVTGLVGLGLAAAFGGAFSVASAPAAPAAAQPTAAPAAAQPTAAPAAAQPTAAPAAAASAPTEPIGPALASGSGEAVSLSSDGDATRFAQDRIEVPNGLVTLTFANTGIAVQHNWVLVEGGQDVAAAANDAAAAAAASARSADAAVPPADTPGLLVATQQIQPGSEVTVTFETPGPGTYTFLCTFPGHFAGGMVGELVVN